MWSCLGNFLYQKIQYKLCISLYSIGLHFSAHTYFLGDFYVMKTPTIIIPEAEQVFQNFHFKILVVRKAKPLLA